MTSADKELINNLNGLYVGMLDNGEIESFNKCVKEGYAVRDYNHQGGILGLAKVKVINKGE